MIWVLRLISIAVILQTIEYLYIRWSLNDLDPWSWKNKFLDNYLYPALLWLRLAAAVIALFAPTLLEIGVMLITTWVIAVRWRGTFNGGSDSMTFHVLLGLALGAQAGATYVAFIAALSYFVAGLSKLNSKAWRHGEALPLFLKSSHGARFSSAKVLLGFAAVAVITFEIMFPLVFVVPNSLYFFLPVGAVFHLANFYLFGLNRFFFAWIATYPAIILCAA